MEFGRLKRGLFCNFWTIIQKPGHSVKSVSSSHAPYGLIRLVHIRQKETKFPAFIPGNFFNLTLDKIFFQRLGDTSRK